MRRRITDNIELISTPEGMKSEGGNVLVVDDHRSARESVAEILEQAGHTVAKSASGPEALALLGKRAFHCVLSDLQMPGMDGIALIREIKKRGIDSRILLMTAHGSVGTAVEAMRLGAFDYLEKPCDIDRLERLIDQAVRHFNSEKRSGESCDSVPGKMPIPAFIGSGPLMRALRTEIERIARTRETVLISGESGTGKEVVAKTIHSISCGNKNPFVALNCPALSGQLMESELFGHVKGAFTGAESERIGRFQAAGNGTILLDEITEIEYSLQSKLLRVLQERSFEMVGSSETREVRARVIATTNREVHAEVAAGRFREDLFYRLSVLPLHVPPLRERKEDIPELLVHFLGNADKKDDMDLVSRRFESDAIEIMYDYDWPGNVRQLENLVTRAGVLDEGEKVSAADLRRWLGADLSRITQRKSDDLCVLEGKYEGSTGRLRFGSPERFEEPSHGDGDFAFPEGMSLEEMERLLIEATFRKCNGHRGKTAEMLKIGVRTLNGKLRQYGYAPREKVSERIKGGFK